MDKEAPPEVELSAKNAKPEEAKKGRAGSIKSEKETKPKTLSEQVLLLYENGYCQLYLSILLIVSLFLSSAWILANAADQTDDVKDGILLWIFVTFILESVLLSFVLPGYFLSFFFWMDVVGTLSIVLDISWISNTFMPESSNQHQKGSILRAARAAKLGARYGRLMRLLKFVKFFKMFPCFKSGADDAPEPTMSAVRKVSQVLSEVLSRRVAALVMLLVIIVPFLNYETTDSSLLTWGDVFQTMIKNTTYTSYDYDTRIQDFHDYYNGKDTNAVKAKLRTYAGVFVRDFGTTHLRSSNVITFEADTHVDIGGGVFEKYSVHLETDYTVPNQWNALFGILLIILVILVLVGFTASFNSAVDALIVVPLEKMMGTLRKSASDMLRSMQVMDKSVSEENRVLDDDLEEELETALLEKMVEKLARIVKQVTGRGELEVDANVDKATAVWLTENFSTATKRIEEKKRAESLSQPEMEYNVDQAQEQLRLMEGHSTVDPTVVNSWNFDVLKYTTAELMEVCNYLFDVFHLFQEFKCPSNIMAAFLQDISGRYMNNPYHNFPHAIDVTQTVYRMIMVPQLNLVLTSLDIFSMLIAAVGHDVGHPGVNNAFLVKVKDELALRHNDRSPLENMHCSLLYQILGNPATNIQCGLSLAQWRDSRKIVLALILGTDMVHHFEQISKAQVFLEVNGDDTKRFCRGQQEQILCLADEKSKLFFMEVLLHSSDISNPFKPFAICEQWADLVVAEFFQQGDKEAAMGMDISPMMDRRNSNMYNMQLGFIEFVVSPLINSVVNILPPLYELATHLTSNFQTWGERRKAEIRGDAISSAVASKLTLEAAATTTAAASETHRSPRASINMGPSRPDLKPEVIEECNKMDDRVAKFKEKITSLKINEHDRVRHKRSSFNTHSSG